MPTSGGLVCGNTTQDRCVGPMESVLKILNENMTYLINESMTKVFVEQPRLHSGSVEYMNFGLSFIFSVALIIQA